MYSERRNVSGAFVNNSNYQKEPVLTFRRIRYKIGNVQKMNKERYHFERDKSWTSITEFYMN